MSSSQHVAIVWNAGFNMVLIRCDSLHCSSFAGRTWQQYRLQSPLYAASRFDEKAIPS